MYNYRIALLFGAFLGALQASNSLLADGSVAAPAPIITRISKQEFPPEKTALVFDLHGVLFNFDRDMLWQRLGSGTCYMIYHAARIAWTQPGNITALKDACEPLANCQKKAEKTWTALQKAVNEGYQVYIFSNVRPETFAKLSEAHPELISADYFTGHIITGPATQWLTKPNPRYFDICEALVQEKSAGVEKILFFDDKASNCTIASKRTGTISWTGVTIENDQQCATILDLLYTTS